MGIRVYCPNGHKLNIKVALAGKRGICPHCGAKFAIPPLSGQTEANDADGTVATSVDLDTDPPETDEARAPAGSDPLAEMPDATWYLRPPTGGQFGPAQADVMRTWLAEGRVTSDSLVWREGWPEWLPASDVFGDRVTASEPGEPSVGPPVEPGEPAVKTTASVKAPWDLPAATENSATEVIPPIKVVTEPTRPSTFARRPRRRSTQLVVWLSVIVVFLGAILIWVLNRS
ncbi:MAG: DUF4339 domain-containing protein [Pirellulales bacterium]|nr:DUF4339 domain-containing protein [Pirellulales bacterium]